MIDIATLEERLQAFLPGLLGIKFRDAAPDRVRAGLAVQDRLCTVPGILDGGAIMAFADTLGAVGTVLNLKPGESTTTIESKTNFLSAGKGGTTVEGECSLLHRGRRTMVWQTRVTAPDGKLIALVTQTQAVMEAPQPASDVMAAMFAGKSLRDREELLSTLERAGAAMYRSLAKDSTEPEVRAELERAALREEENAKTLERLLAR
jgi:uncharacterized protein (TIGR00369 family)